MWRPRALDAWRRAQFTIGQTILDIGCGPGYASADLAAIAGRVIAVDRSRRFLDVLRARGNPRIEAHEVDLDDDELPAQDADGAWVRWVFAFVKQPRDLAARIRSALKPGGVLVIHEYFDYETWSFLPRCEEHEEFVRAVTRSWRAAGGEPNIGRDLPRWLEDLGFEIRSLLPIIDAVRPNDFAWQWPRTFVRTGMQRLIDIGEIAAPRGAEILRAVERVEADRNAIIVTPAVLEIIAVRR